MSKRKLPRPPDAEHLSARPIGARSTVADLRLARYVSQDATVSGTCWRCGGSIERTTDVDLRRCCELAQASA